MSNLLKAIENLRTESAESGSDRLILSVQGQVVADDSSGRAPWPIELMSGTKSIVSLGIGILLKNRLISSLDIPLCDFFPEWNSGLKKEVRLRHILNHTSGIKARRTTEDIYKSPDFLKFALKSEIFHKPGSNFFYNNKATQILSGVVEGASGQRLDHFLDEFLFKPLRITDWTWELDKAGNPHAFAGLALRGEDLLKIGMVVLNGGTYLGHTFFDSDWVIESFKQGQPYDPTCGLLWWRNSRESFFSYDSELIDAYIQAGLSSDQCQKLLLIPQNTPFKDFRQTLEKVLGGKEEVDAFIEFANTNMLSSRCLKMSEAEVFSAHGYLGQYLSIIPDKKIIALRQMDYRSVKDQNVAEFSHFRKLVMEVGAALSDE